MNDEIDVTLANSSNYLYDQVRCNMSSDKNTPSADKLQQQTERHKCGIKKKRSVTKSKDNSNGTVVMPETGGNSLLSVLLKGKGHTDHVYAELQ